MDKVLSALGTPYFQTDSFLLYNIDCVEAMTKLKEKESPQFNLTVTSPPYNIGKEYETTMKPEAYVNWCREWIQLIHALTKSTF
jgi:adenine-specific DNA-methyltransferase